MMMMGNTHHDDDCGHNTYFFESTYAARTLSSARSRLYTHTLYILTHTHYIRGTNYNDDDDDFSEKVMFIEV